MSERTAVVSALSLTKEFVRGSERVHAVEDVTFELNPGELIALLGPSGSGKTTVLNLLAGWEEPDDGRLLWEGSERVRGFAGLGWDELALLPQTHGLLNELSVRENVSLPNRLGSLSIEDERVTQILDELGLSQLADRLPHEISLGEQQRAALARALVGSPRVLLADEPSGHQDAVWAPGVFKALRHACQKGTSCLVATHNEEVLNFVDRILEMRDGRIVVTGDPRPGDGSPSLARP